MSFWYFYSSPPPPWFPLQRATLAEKEVNSLKEKLSTTDRGVTTNNNNNNSSSNNNNNNDGNDMDVTAPPPPPSLSASTLPTSLPLATSTCPATPPTSSSPMLVADQNGLTPPSPSTTPFSDPGGPLDSPSEKRHAGSRSPGARTPDIDASGKVATHTINNNCIASSNNNSALRSPTRSPSEKMDCDGGDKATKEGDELSSSSSSSSSSRSAECHKGASEKLTSASETNCSSGGGGDAPESQPNKDQPMVDSRTRSLTEELSAKDREVSAICHEY
uniref:Uncharacterized protein n=1 Tax=Anopheles dirus TaxID=7168 RepID=A0A182NQW0_9DIPT